MAEKICSHCIHVDVCENRFSWLDQEDNTKHVICHHFKPAADVVEVVRCINKQPAVDAEELACRFVSEEMRQIVSLIARGLRHVALPEEMPERIGIVIDYPQTTVRHEFVPRNDEKE